MDLLHLKDLLSNSGWSLIILLTLIQIAPIKINPWNSVLKFLGRLMNAELNEKMDGFKGDLDSLSKKVDTIQQSVDENEAKNARARIVSFADKLLNSNERSTRDKFESILIDTDVYE